MLGKSGRKPMRKKDICNLKKSREHTLTKHAQIHEEKLKLFFLVEDDPKCINFKIICKILIEFFFFVVLAFELRALGLPDRVSLPPEPRL
jgi:hypothetical protein